MKLMSARSSLAAGAAINGETRSGDLGGAGEIQNTQLLADIPMVLRLKIELRRLAPAAYFAVIVFALADRNARMRQIRQSQHEALELALRSQPAAFAVANRFAHLFAFAHQRARIARRFS